MSSVHADGQALRFEGPLTLRTVGALEAQTRRLLTAHRDQRLRIELEEVSRLDTAGAVFLRRLPELARALGAEAELGPLPSSLRAFYEFIAAPPPPPPVAGKEGILERLGSRLVEFGQQAADFAFLMSDLSWSTAVGLFRRGGIRRGTFTDQAFAIGAQALPIIGLILFLVGAVSSLQAAAQLRQFGADIYVADLLAIGITRELGPLMTAIMVSGRSGSAIAAEISTMKFTEELDALRTMALEPLRFVAVPKMWAMLLCVPLLTIMADFLGILGGTFIGITSLGIAPKAFVAQVVSSLFLKDIVTGLIKSVSFAWIITIIAVYRGLNFSGGAAGVGHATTSSVVASIFGIILLDSFWGLLFYLK